MKYLIWIALLLGFIMPVAADVALLTRVDVGKSGEPFYSEAVFTPQVELWCYGDNRIEAGKLIPARILGQKCLAGGYLAWRMEAGKIYAEPYAIFSKMIGNLRLKVKPDGYLPLNGGRFSGGLDELSLTVPINDHARIGPSMTNWRDESTTSRYGLQIEIESNRMLFYGRYLVGNGDKTVRIQLTRKF